MEYVPQEHPIGFQGEPSGRQRKCVVLESLEHVLYPYLLGKTTGQPQCPMNRGTGSVHELAFDERQPVLCVHFSISILFQD